MPRPNPTRQRRQAHRKRKAYARALHQLFAIRNRWLAAWRGGRRPGRIALPKLLWQHERALMRAFYRGA